MDKRFKLRWLISDQDSGISIKDFVKENKISKAALTDIKFEGGKILVNQQEMNVRYRLKSGDTLEIIFPAESPSEGLRGENIPLSIVYEDEYVLIINKPPFMNTIPSREHPTGSLANGLLGYYERIGLQAATHIVTRLDRNTSGLVLIAKHRHVHHLLSESQKSGLVTRKYVAFVHGNLQEESGVIEAPIGRKLNSIIEREVSNLGQYACTYYQVLNRTSLFNQVELKLETGRTHQIRVHMSYIGHPLLGDDLYGGSLSLINRQALHCKSVAFIHPFNKEVISIEVPIPEDMDILLGG
jgi:23S rRNA pseudouridine1911/1915/1917 synthase